MEPLLKSLPNGDAIADAYNVDMARCKQAGEKEYQCTKDVGEKYSRQLPGMKDTVYPWSNYDWDYSTYIDNNYNAHETGATEAGTFGALFDNPIALMKLGGGFVYDPNPGSGSTAGYSDSTECDPNEADYQGCQILNEIKQSQMVQDAPFPDPFFDKYPLDGKNSSSYYVQVGICPKTDMTEEQCKEHGWQWVGNDLFGKTLPSIIPKDFIPGMCFKPRYGFVKNQPGFKIDLSVLKTLNNLAAKGESGVMSGLTGGGASNAIGQAGIEVNREMGNAMVNMSQASLNALLSLYEGAVPSVFGDVLDMSPIALFQILEGQSTEDFALMDCDEGFRGSREGFACPQTPVSKRQKMLRILLAVLLGLILFLVWLSYHHIQEII